MAIIVIMLIISIILTVLVGKVIFANSFGSFKAYAIGYFWIWVACFVLVGGIFNKIGLLKVTDKSSTESQASDSSQTVVIDESESETSSIDDSSEI